MTLKIALMSAGLTASLALPLASLADEWEYRRESNRYQTDVDLDGYRDVDIDVDDDFDVDVDDDDGFDVDVGRNRYRVDWDDFDVDEVDAYGVEVDVDDDDGWRVSVRDDWDRGYESDRSARYERYDFQPGPYDRYERGYARRGYVRDDRGRFDAYDRDRLRERRDVARGDEFIPDRGVGQYYGRTTPEERYYKRGSEYFSRNTPSANQYAPGIGQQRGTAFRDDTDNRYRVTRYEQWTDTGRDGWYDEDNSGSAYSYDYEVEYDIDYDD